MLSRAGKLHHYHKVLLLRNFWGNIKMLGSYISNRITILRKYVFSAFKREDSFSEKAHHIQRDRKYSTKSKSSCVSISIERLESII